MHRAVLLLLLVLLSIAADGKSISAEKRAMTDDVYFVAFAVISFTVMPFLLIMIVVFAMVVFCPARCRLSSKDIFALARFFALFFVTVLAFLVVFYTMFFDPHHHSFTFYMSANVFPTDTGEPFSAYFENADTRPFLASPATFKVTHDKRPKLRRFIILSSQGSGSTWFSRQLGQHSAVYTAFPCEPLKQFDR